MSVKVAFYASAHGYGHASRSYEIAKTLVARGSNITVDFISWVPDAFFAGETHPRIRRWKRRLDVGIHQVDSLTMDIKKTLQDLEELAQRSDQIIDQEVDFLGRNRIYLVLCDMPHLAFEAAHRAGIPSWGISNFSWDWIYEEYSDDFPAFRNHITRIREAYRLAEGVFRLPFSGGMTDFKRVEDMPLLARRSELGKEESRSRLKLEKNDTVVLFSFGGFQLDVRPVSNLAPGVVLLASEPSPDPGPPFRHVTSQHLEELGLRYCDLVAAADIVVSKLGYGIVSECIANRTALIYTPRGRFREYPILAEGIKDYLPSISIESKDLEGGEWLAQAHRLKALPFPPAPDCSGAETIVARILARMASV